MRTVARTILGLTCACLTLAGCGEQHDAVAGPKAASGSPVAAKRDTQPVGSPSMVTGAFQPYTDDARAITYVPEEIPTGARVMLLARTSTPAAPRTKNETAEKPSTDSGTPAEDSGATPGIVSTSFTFALTGLPANEDYGAHLHTRPCGPHPGDAGPHYQNVEAPEGVENDPTYTNPRNEAWLDFTTDSDGDGSAMTTVEWVPREGEANSIVIHANPTPTAAGHAGDAGQRLGCVNVAL
ncbi:superoxide dismutase family protein [Salinactinospora qingdaonensis]|uniref:Superoxide dismutase copper/zinc binding domain-containing protein n=1 Tax=Salinactinospora qingdaonensis TaxID=702744 RepID=A0ABP7F661_9ACTN